MNNFLYILLILFFTSACAGLSDAKKVLKNEKTATTDEFLVKKRNHWSYLQILMKSPSQTQNLKLIVMRKKI